jgi:predicted hotdog family 3-hydroxylacyl-ACP dehydratase
MSLLDSIESYSEDGLIASVTIREDSQFITARGVPAWVGIEYMGQAIAAVAGARARDNSEPVQIGFLVSSRRYKSSVSFFEIGDQLQVDVSQVTDNAIGLQVFKCRISADNIEVTANLNVYLPDDVEAFLKESQ